jgi:hypothetical protein
VEGTIEASLGFLVPSWEGCEGQEAALSSLSDLEASSRKSLIIMATRKHDLNSHIYSERDLSILCHKSGLPFPFLDRLGLDVSLRFWSWDLE